MADDWFAANPVPPQYLYGQTVSVPVPAPGTSTAVPMPAAAPISKLGGPVQPPAPNTSSALTDTSAAPVAGAAPLDPTAATSAAPPSGGNPTDPAYVSSWLQWMATQPGADPILQTPQGQAYYQNVILSNGGLTDTNYWQNKATLASSGGAVGAGAGGSGGGLTSQGSGSIDGLGFNQPFNAPSAADAENTPGYQFAFGQGQKALMNSQFARGTGLTGGAAKALVNYGNGMASEGYQQTYNNAMQQYLNSYNIFNSNLTGSTQRNQFQQTLGEKAASDTAA